jgi:hypothetical protein
MRLVYHFSTIIGRRKLLREGPEGPKGNNQGRNRDHKRGSRRGPGEREAVCHLVPDRAFLRITLRLPHVALAGDDIADAVVELPL